MDFHDDKFKAEIEFFSKLEWENFVEEAVSYHALQQKIVDSTEGRSAKLDETATEGAADDVKLASVHRVFAIYGQKHKKIEEYTHKAPPCLESL